MCTKAGVFGSEGLTSFRGENMISMKGVVGMFSPYGRFIEEGRGFEIFTPDIPRNWYNYFFTDQYVTFTSQCGIGQGFLQDSLGRRISPVSARALYAVEGDAGWELSGLPVYDKHEDYKCIHRPGSTEIVLTRHGIRTGWTLFVPPESDPFTGAEVSVVEVENLSQREREIKLISYTENDLDGAYKYQGYNTRAVEKQADFNGLKLDFNEMFEGKKRAFTFFCFCDRPLTGWDAAKNRFIGPYNTLRDPIALHRGGCTNSACVAEKACYALETAFTLKPGETASCCFVTVLTANAAKAEELLRRFRSAEDAKSELSALTERIRSATGGGLTLRTPDENFNCLINNWLKYQTNLGSRWARVRHNGYRDIASDTECLAVYDPALAWQRIKRLLSYQYANGYAPRTFIDGQIRDNNFSDCAVWLSFTVYYIINELGDAALLSEQVPFNDGSSASVWEHVKRSVEFLHGFTGHHGLIRIWGGDWNDCMNNVGIKGKGVSVWLSIAFVRAARMACELAKTVGDETTACTFTDWAEDMCRRVNEYGWDEKGGYYIYAISDDGERIGASDCEEGSVFLNPQLWAVLAGGLGAGREEKAIENAYALLWDELGTRVSTPPYTEKNAWIGGIGEKAPGVQENGGVYLHAMCWKLAVDALRGDSKRVGEDIVQILPFTNPVVNGRAEPYSICNCYMGRETGYRYGTPGQSWRTASGQWLLKAMAQFVFGLQPSLEGLRIKPCLPDSWNEACAEKEFRGHVYKIRYLRGGMSKILFNGKELSGDLLPLEDGEVTVYI